MMMMSRFARKPSEGFGVDIGTSALGEDTIPAFPVVCSSAFTSGRAMARFSRNVDALVDNPGGSA